MPLPLFQVPGWSVSTEPASSSSSKKSKKRKRPHDHDALDGFESDLQKHIDALGRAIAAKQPPKKKHKGKRSKDSSEGVADNKPTAATPPKASSKKAKPKDVRTPSKKSKGTHPAPKEKGTSEKHRHPKVADSEDPGLTTLQNGMKKKLDGARFR